MPQGNRYNLKWPSDIWCRSVWCPRWDVLNNFLKKVVALKSLTKNRDSNLSSILEKIHWGFQLLRQRIIENVPRSQWHQERRHCKLSLGIATHTHSQWAPQRKRGDLEEEHLRGAATLDGDCHWRCDNVYGGRNVMARRALTLSAFSNPSLHFPTLSTFCYSSHWGEIQVHQKKKKKPS